MSKKKKKFKVSETDEVNIGDLKLKDGKIMSV